MASKRVGFTLAEVLIALALLGVVAAFTIPKIMQSQGENQKKALFKETIAAISEIYYRGSFDGTLPRTATTWGPMQKYLWDRLNVVSVYRTDNPPLTEACSISASPGYGGVGPCAVMPNGVTIQALDPGLDDLGSPIPEEIFFVDYNGKNPPNTMGQDVLMVHIRGLNTTQPVVARAWVSPVVPENVTLWNQIFQ